MDLEQIFQQLTAAREEIYQTGKMLSRRLGLDIGQLAEVEMRPGRSMILGGYGYLGLIDDNMKRIDVLGNGSALCRHAFNSVYSPLEQGGYKINNVKNTRFLGEGDDSEVLRCLMTEGVVDFARRVAEGKENATAVLTMADGERSYDRSQMIGAAAFLGGSLGEALALSAAVKDGQPILQASPSSKTSLEARSLRVLQWTKPERDQTPSPSI